MQSVSGTPVKNNNCNNEEALLFDFIQTLSPIKPVKPICVTQMVTSLAFDSLPSVFTSPQLISKHRIPTGHSVLDSLPQQEITYENLRTVVHSDESMSCEEHQFEAPRITESEIDRLYGQSSIGTAAVSRHIILPTVSEDHEQFESPGVKSGVEPKKELFRWECRNSLLDGNDMFVFNSPDGAEILMSLASRSPDWNQTFFNSLTPRFLQNEVGKGRVVAQMNPYQQHTLLDSSSLIECMDNVSTAGDHPSVRYPEDYVAMSMEQDFPNKPIPGHHHGLRRCLEYETAERAASDFMQLAAGCHLRDDTSLRGIAPEIGFHLDAAAMSPNKHKCEHLSAETRCSTMRISPVSLELPEYVHMPPHAPFMSDVSKEGLLLVEDDSPAYGNFNGEELNESSLQRKRHKGENSGEKGACKRCNCKKSKCLKLYCECFAAGVFCTDPCTCQQCLNKPIHCNIVIETRKQIESRNPIAFAPKVIRDSSSQDDNEVESSKTPTSARHKKGCNCKRSGCSKKYCECYQSGVGCSFNCRCEGCKNSFGRKDGSFGSSDTVTDSTSQAAEEHNKKHAKKGVHPTYPRTSSCLSPFPQATFMSISKRPRSSSLVMPTTLDQTNRLLGKLYFPGSWSKLENHPFTKSAEDEVPRILRNCTNTPNYGLKTSSPNSKRVSPPNKGKDGCFVLTAEARSGRRMMLKSIPSFPSL
ncbi:hypothetical protein MLD38_027314 [Melastoma candidum]|uniref:Uncharacterized protein n=1 Tax=Melastoma candidum TaxID=119954 RepID=A0ACB9P2F0_9MYRT|nr:hypothetical protein MLD38_027314 [Melastoma candidum]